MTSKVTKRFVLKGAVKVSYRRSGGEWLATAVPFDIIGVGKSKAEALALMKELVEDYMTEVVRELLAGNKVQFYNPSDAKEWNLKDSDHFIVHIEIEVAARRSPRPLRDADEPAEISELSELVKSINSLDCLESIELVPA